MKKFLSKLHVPADTSGQDLLDYVLMAAFVAMTACAVLPGVASSVSAIFSQVDTVMAGAASQGGATGPTTQSTSIPTP